MVTEQIFLVGALTKIQGYIFLILCSLIYRIAIKLQLKAYAYITEVVDTEECGSLDRTRKTEQN